MKIENPDSGPIQPPQLTDPKIGFVGAGAMGTGMILHLRKNHFRVSFYCRATKRGTETAGQLSALGARQAADLSELAREADVVILCLPDSATVESILAPSAGLTSHLRAGSVVIDCSSSHPESTRRLSSALASRAITLLDAPLTGSRAQAQAGTLNVLGAGPRDSFDKVRPILQGFARRVFYLGESGAGHAAKLINNFLFQIAMAGLCECWPLLQKYNLNTDAFFEAISVSGGNSAMFQGTYPRFLTRDFSLNFAQRLACKDVRYLVELTKANGLPSPMADALLSLHERATADGFGDADITRILTFYESLRAQADPMPADVRTTGDQR